VWVWRHFGTTSSGYEEIDLTSTKIGWWGSLQRTAVLAVVRPRRGHAAAVGCQVADGVGNGRVGVDSSPRFRRRKVVTAGAADGRGGRVSLRSLGPVRWRVDPGFVLPDRTRRVIDVDRGWWASISGLKKVWNQLCFLAFRTTTTTWTTAMARATTTASTIITIRLYEQQQQPGQQQQRQHQQQNINNNNNNSYINNNNGSWKDNFSFLKCDFGSSI